MKLWMSGRVDHDIEDEKFRKVLNDVLDAVNAMLVNKDYGESIESWDVIMIIYREPTFDYFRYSARNKETDIEVSIDHKKFKEGTINECKELFFDALILSMQKLKQNKRITSFLFDQVINDVSLVERTELLK